MMETEIYQLIEQYLQKELSEKERLDFQQRLEKEPALAEALAFRKASLRYLKVQSGLPALQKEMAAHNEQYFGDETPKKIKKRSLQRWLWPVAAAACVLLTLMLWNPFQPDPYQRFAQHQPLSLTEKSDAARIGSEAESSFNTQDYPKAYVQLKIFLTQQPSNKQAELALGIAAMETADYTEAATIFNRLAQGSSVYKTAGQWYIALLYVKQKQYEEAKKAVALIPPTDTFYYAKAKALLRALP